MLVPLFALLQVAGGPLGTPAGALGLPTPANSPGAVYENEIYSGAQGQLDVAVPRLVTEIEVDGVLNEAPWAEAAVLTGFSQYKPVDGLPADDNTEVLVWYSPDAIHFGIRAFEPHGSPTASLADRDKIESDDHVQILLDTFNDGRSAIVFGVNPFGVQADGSRVEQQVSTRTTSSNTNRDPVDLSQDFLYESQGRLTDWGYEIEVRIPFKSLSYPSEDTQSWGINVIRRVQHSGHEQTWTRALLGRASFLAQGGTLRDLAGFERGLVLDINPVVTSAINGVSQTAGWEYDAQQPEFGGNIRWGLTSNLTMNGTVNPDFSQVEADQGQTQYDPRRAVFFAEKRPFFLEGSEYFQTPNRLIYTRRIASPVAATKFTGKIGGTELAILSAANDKALSASEDDYPIYNFVRIKRDVGEESTVGIAYTDRVDGSDYNRVAKRRHPVRVRRPLRSPDAGGDELRSGRWQCHRRPPLGPQPRTAGPAARVGYPLQRPGRRVGGRERIPQPGGHRTAQRRHESHGLWPARCQGGAVLGAGQPGHELASRDVHGRWRPRRHIEGQRRW